VAVDSTPSMNGFEWSQTEDFVSPVEGANGWCVRDAICRLFGWSPGSEEAKRFIEGPQGEDTPRLAEHLGLAVFQVPQDWNELIQRLDHPGVAVFNFKEYNISHSVYVHDLRWLFHHWPGIDGLPAKGEDQQLWSYGWPLSPGYIRRGPVLGAVLIDEQQPPRDP
jgi:hypothetical protein